MLSAVNDYFRALGQAFANGWNRFWFTPSDPYPLGVIRLLTGLLAIYLHATLTPDLVRFFGADGWLPVEAVERLTVRGSAASYLSYFSGSTDLLLVHLVGLAVLVLFAAGYWTRLTSILALVVILSDIHRGPMLTSQFEPVLTMVLFYLCLGPAGASWSVDRLLARRKSAATPGAAAPGNPAPSFMATVAVRLIQVHLAMLIATMGFSKLLGDGWWTGVGVLLLATRSDSRLADFTGLHRYAINLWTHAVVAFEIGFPVLIWVPLARPLLLAAAVVLWTSVALLTGQVTFSLMLLVASLSYCSPAWLRSLSGSAR